MPLHYRTGEQIEKGDRVTYQGLEGEIELVADPGLKDTAAEEYWYVETYGGGVTIREAKVFGRVFLHADGPDGHENLIFVSRAAQGIRPPRSD